jgi:hypothetical protein
MAQRAVLSALPVLYEDNMKDGNMTKLLVLAVTALGLLLTSANSAVAAKGKQVCRDSKTGQYVSAAYAKKYPGLTVCEAKNETKK